MTTEAKPAFIIHAKLSGYCASCNEIIKEGDPITQDGMLVGKWVHDSCYLPGTDDAAHKDARRDDNRQAAYALMHKLDRVFNQIIDGAMYLHEETKEECENRALKYGLEWIEAYDEMKKLLRRAFRD